MDLRAYETVLSDESNSESESSDEDEESLNVDTNAKYTDPLFSGEYDYGIDVSKYLYLAFDFN